jgi:hypothetical protein
VIKRFWTIIVAVFATILLGLGISVATASSASAASTTAQGVSAGWCYNSWLANNEYQSCIKAATNTTAGAWAPRTGVQIVNELKTYCYQQSRYGWMKAYENARNRLGDQLGNSLFGARHPMC